MSSFQNQTALPVQIPQASVPGIVPNRRHLDNRFPVLGFTLRSDRPGFYEVLLTTDRSLFDPSKAGQRTPANFYSSRQDSKLVPIARGQAVYLVPTAALKSFAKAQTGAFEIFYAVVTYSSADGRDPLFSVPADSLSKSAPSVPVAASFRGHAVPTAFGLSLNGHRNGSSGNGYRSSHGLETTVVDPREDRCEGEDGAWSNPPEQKAEASERALNARRATRQPAQSASTYYDDGYSDDQEADTQSPPTPIAQPASLRYSDGYDEQGEGEDGSFSRSQESEFQAGAQEPSRLTEGYGDDDDGDEEDGDRPTYRMYAEAKSAGGKSERAAAPYAGAASYGDESDAWDQENLPPYQSLAAEDAAPGPQLTIETKRDLIRKLGEYSAVIADGEFEGDFGKKHSAYHKYHLGLSYGVVLFNQDAGHLGQLLSMMKDRNETRFREIFGDQSDQLLKVTNAKGPASKDSAGGRSARVQPVGGTDLWQQPWLSNFQEAGDEVLFQAAQNQLASSLFLDPMLPFANSLGFKTERLLAALVTCAAAMGVDNSKQWIVNTVSPVQTPAQRQQAMAALKQKDITSFQKATPGLQASGHWDPETQVAVIAALRALAEKSPVPVGSADQMVAAMIRRSSGAPWLERLQHISDANDLSDVPVEF